MNRHLRTPKYILPAFGLLLFLLVFSGCSSKADLETQISGKWQLAEGKGSVDINLADNPKTLIIDGNTYSVAVEGIDKGSNTVQVKVETAPGKTELWSLRQVWDDNGSTFTLAFKHNGTTQKLVPPSQS